MKYPFVFRAGEMRLRIASKTRLKSSPSLFRLGASETTSEAPQFNGTIDEAKKLAVECAKRIIAERKEVTSQDLYDCGMLKESFERGYLQILSTKYKSFVDVINDFFVFQDGLWRCK